MCLEHLSHKKISIAQDVWTTFALFYDGDSQEQWSSAAIFIVFRIFQDKLQLVLFRTSEMTEILKSEIDLVYKRLLAVFLNTSNLNTQSDHT